jgi:hypothetical protein
VFTRMEREVVVRRFLGQRFFLSCGVWGMSRRGSVNGESSQGRGCEMTLRRSLWSGGFCLPVERSWGEEREHAQISP